MSTSKTATEQLHTQTNANESTETVSLHQTNDQYGRSPLWIRGNEEEGYYITIGQYKITNNYETQKEAFERLLNPDAEMITDIIAVILEDFANQNGIKPNITHIPDTKQTSTK